MKKKVLLVAPLPPPYGGICHWTAMVERHSKMEGKIPLHVVDTAPRHATIFDKSFFKRALKGLPGLIGQVFQVLRTLRHEEVIAVHVTSAGHFGIVRDIWMLWLARLFRRRSILHLHFGRVPALLDSTGIMPFIVRIGLKSASHVIAIDEATTRAIRGTLPSVSVSMVPNCIDYSTLPDIPARRSQKIVFVGWVLQAKGIEELLGAWEKITPPNWSLKIIGPYEDEYAADLAGRYNLEGVEFAGALRNSEALVEIADAALLCLPSYTEGFPNVVLEAMALKCAVLATPVGAIPEMLADGAGMIVEVRNETQLANRLLELIEDPVCRERLADQAHEKVNRKYRLEKIYEAYEAIWKGEEIG